MITGWPDDESGHTVIEQSKQLLEYNTDIPLLAQSMIKRFKSKQCICCVLVVCIIFASSRYNVMPVTVVTWLLSHAENVHLNLEYTIEHQKLKIIPVASVCDNSHVTVLQLQTCSVSTASNIQHTSALLIIYICSAEQRLVYITVTNCQLLQTSINTT